nr:DUF739 family protein [Enterocloster bolteae]
MGKEGKRVRKVVFDYSKLRGRIVEKYGTQRRFAMENQLSDRSMSLKLNNDIRLSQEEIMKWCELLDIDTQEIPVYFFAQKVSK